MGIRLNELKNRFNGSVMVYIKGSLVGIISLAITTLFASYWITELADLDAKAINLSGSLRMESYQLGMFGLEGNKQEIDKRIAQIGREPEGHELEALTHYIRKHVATLSAMDLYRARHGAHEASMKLMNSMSEFDLLLTGRAYMN